MKRVHGIDSGLRRFTPGALKNEADIIKHLDVLKKRAIKTILKLAAVEERLGADLMPDKGTAWKVPLKIFEDSERFLPELRTGAPGGYENSTVGKGTDATFQECPAPYRRPRRSAISRSSSRRFRSLAPDAACLSERRRSMRPSFDGPAAGSLPFLRAEDLPAARISGF